MTVRAASLGWIALLTAACGTSGTPPEAPGNPCPAAQSGSGLSGDTRAEARQKVEYRHFEEHPDCKGFEIIATRVLRSSEDTGSDEAWTVKSCGGTCFDYSVRVRPRGQGFAVMVAPR